jgi:hypothetical protein
MSLDPQLAAQLAETVYVAAASTVDSAGDYGYGAPAARAARVVDVASDSEGPDGTSEATDVVLIVQAEVLESDKVWLPGVDQTDAALARRPKRIERGVGELGSVDFFRVTV